MMIIWYRQVTKRLLDSSLLQKKKLTQKLKILFEELLLKDIDKCLGTNLLEKAISSDDKIIDCSMIDITEEHHHINHFELSSVLSVYSTTDSLTNHSTHKGLFTSPMEEFNSFEFRAKFLVEQILCMILDIGCTEYSTFYLNSTKV